jgi:D-glycero-alpha-D-manno-heptose-7-phosphate kinase
LDIPYRVTSRTPVRLNDIGGWTDTWFAKHGRVLNLAASPGVEADIRAFPDHTGARERVRLTVHDFGDSFTMDPVRPDPARHPLLQASVASVSLPPDIRLEIELRSSVPAGIGVGTSASVCVALLAGLLRITGAAVVPSEVAARAHAVETKRLGWQAGIQDQICAAVGGVCFIDMWEYPESRIEGMELPDPVFEELDRRLSLVYLGRSHRSSALHERVIASLEGGGPESPAIRRMRELPLEARACLRMGDLEAYGDVMVRNNECQRSLHPDLVSEEADLVIAAVRDLGAAGWKVNGAGGKGGSLTVLGDRDPERNREMVEVIRRLGRGIRTLPVRLSRTGLNVSVGTS